MASTLFFFIVSMVFVFKYDKAETEAQSLRPHLVPINYIGD